MNLCPNIPNFSVDLSLEPNITNVHQCIEQLNLIVETNLSLSDLKTSVTRLKKDVKWYPEYGCAVLLTQSEFVGKCDIKLVLLDGWELRRSCSGGMVEQHAISQCSQALSLGQVPLKDALEIEEKVGNSVIALKRGGKNAAKSQGHQKTPAFIEALYKQAIDTKDDNEKDGDVEIAAVAPYGGTTDCGRHTGGKPRATPWFLVWAVFGTIIENRVKTTNAKVAYYISCMNDSSDVNYVMEAIQAVVPLLEFLNKEHVDIADQVRYVTTARRILENESLTVNEARARDFCIVKTNPKFPTLIIPQSEKKSEEAEGSIRDLALRAIGQIRSLPVEMLNLADTLNWCKSHPDKLVVVAFIEAVFHDLAQHLKISDDSLLDLESLIELKNYFNSIVKPSGLELRSEVKSRKLLVEFITVCVVHRHCLLEYPDVASKRLELSQDSLCTAVFRNKQQEDAALSVIEYLTMVNSYKELYLFSATHGEGTIYFARKHADECPMMNQRLREEKTAVIARRKAYWQQVLAKKKEAKKLRDTLPGLQKEIRDAELRESSARSERDVAKTSYNQAERAWKSENSRLTSCKNSYRLASENKFNSDRPSNDYYKNREHYNILYLKESCTLSEAQNKCDTSELDKCSKHSEFTQKELIYNSLREEVTVWKTKLKDTYSKIADEIKVPKFVVNPLPVDEEDMKVVIFFQMIPKALDYLCLCLFSSQSMLAESTDIPMTHTEERSFNEVWRKSDFPSSFMGHYNRYSEDNKYDEKNLLVYSENLEIPQYFGIQSVDDMFEESHSSLWFPLPDFSFMSATLHDPFRCPASLSKRLYAEPVHEDLQFIVDYPDDDKLGSARGNVGYSKLASLPTGFSQTTFINMCTIRAFPYTQMLRLIDALQEDWLPLGEDIVRVVLAVALGQLGTVTGGRVDVRHLVDGWEQLESRLLKQAERLRNTPRNHREILALGAVAKFMSSHTGRNKVSKLFSSMAVEWAEMAEQEYLEASTSGNNEMLQSLRAKQALMFGYAIICQADLYRVSDAADLAKWIVKFNNCLVFSEDEHEGIQHIIATVRVEMAQKVHSLAFLANDAVLTGAFQSVVQCPDDLHWEMLDYCYEAAKDGNHYMINLLSGCILVNASAPGVLPQHILNDPLYKRSFGDRNFEVISISKNCMETRLPIDGGFTYEFNGTEKIAIRERSNSNVLELVNINLSDLPKRLSMLYSHWYSEVHQNVLFRGVKFNERSVSFIMKHQQQEEQEEEEQQEEQEEEQEEEEQEEEQEGIRCFQVSPSESYDSPSLPYFLSLDGVGEVLSKFERKEYIHVLQYDTRNHTRWELKRFGLCFSSFDEVTSSEDNSGYGLSNYQQMKEFSADFISYLVLEKGQDVRLLIPKGKVVRTGREVSIENSEAPDATLGYYTYDRHARTGEFKCNSVEARLHLAVICVAVSTLLPIPLLKATGSEYALKLLKQSWVNRPYTSEESSKLENLRDFYFNEPGLVVQELTNRRKAAELNFLYGLAEEDVGFDREILAAAEYELDRIENSIEFRNICRKGNLNKSIRFQLDNTVGDLGELPVRYRYKDVKGVEDELQKQLISVARQSDGEATDISFPFMDSDVKPIVKKELEASWHNYLQDPCLTYNEINLDIEIKQANFDIEEKLSLLMSYINRGLATTSAQFDLHLEMNRAANFIPQFTFEDILHVALNKSHLAHFNPYLSDNAACQLHKAVITYLALTVLQDKVQRISSGDCDIALELSCVRKWKPFEHPHWLVFEVENGIQIRPEQYQMVKHLLDNPASISQLTMGSGKTRVLMPMLILEYLATKTGVPRVNVLSNISPECIDYLHAHLTASVFNLHMILQPFHRQVELDDNGIETLRRIGGRDHPAFKLVTPEHRLSLELKYLEMDHCGNPAATHLEELLSKKKQYVDIFDESDALLSHKYQLIYAVGVVRPLDNWEERSVVVQSLLRVLNSDEEVARILSVAGFSVAEEVSAGMFRKIVLSPVCCDANIVDTRILLREALLDALVRSPPPELRWLKRLPAAQRKDVLDISKKAPSLANEKHQAHLLTLRGLLGFGVLEACLEKRSRVHFGLDGRRAKRTAVPFRAADVPSDRSEFSHPDTCLLYTTLSYYYEGLSERQVKEALQKLLELGPEAKKAFYNRAIQSMDLTAEESLQIDEVGKVDLSNLGQMSLLYRKFSLNMEVINFWLNAAVVRKDTGQYPQRIVSNSWDLAASAHIVGFSGTKDNHRLLPLQVKQREPEIPKLLGADAKMMHLLLQQRVLTLDFGFEALLETACSFDALIDTGSLLAGRKLDELAQALLAKVSHQGVMYYKDGWQVLERRSGLAVSRKYSSLRDCECFIVFDEARTRGSDTRMGKQARALLTLGQGLARDKLVQGAGRLRQLGKGQTLVMAGTADVLRGMTEPKQVLEWVLRNTAFDTEEGLAEWATQGMQFHSEELFIDEDWTLKRLYSDAEVKEKLTVVVRRKMSRLTECIVLHCERYGQDVVVSRNGANEECERELQLEEEREQEVEREIDLVHPADETTWDYESVLTASSVSKVATECRLLGDALPKALGWKKHRVYATMNFLTTCKHRLTRTVHETMRRAWGMLLFESEVLLLSDMEANWLCKDVKFTRTVVTKNTVIELYNGETSYDNPKELDSFAVGNAKKLLKEIVEARGLWMNWNYSVLKTACED